MNDVMRELECAIEAGCGTYREVEVTVLKYARSIILEQYAEIERLSAENAVYANGVEKVAENYHRQGRAEAIDEFAERLKAIYNSPMYQPTKEHPIKHTRVELLLCLIDKIAKELKGE